MLVEIEEVVTLQELIGELGEGKSVAGSTVETLLHRLLSHHIVDGDVLTHLTGEVEEGEVFHPVVVIDHYGGIGLLGLEVEETGHLGLNALLIVIERLVVQEVTLLRLARGVADHTGGTTDEDDGTVTTTLQMAEHHDAAEVTDVQGVCRGVGTQIGGDHLLLEQFLGTGHHLCQHTTPFEFFNKVLHTLLYISSII